MKTFRVCRAALCALGLAFAQPLLAHGMHGGTSQLEKYNNDRTIAIQVYGGTQKDSGKGAPGAPDPTSKEGGR